MAVEGQSPQPWDLEQASKRMVGHPRAPDPRWREGVRGPSASTEQPSTSLLGQFASHLLGKSVTGQAPRVSGEPFLSFGAGGSHASLSFQSKENTDYFYDTKPVVSKFL